MRIRKAIAIIALVLAALPLFSSYSVILPERGRKEFIVVSDNGETKALDDTVWYKRWNGLLLENMAPSIYMITEDDDEVLLIGRGATADDIESTMRYADADFIITERLITERAAELFEGDTMLTTERFDNLYAVMLERNGIEAKPVRSGERIMISDGEYASPASEREILVSCPHCGHSFRIFI